MQTRLLQQMEKLDPQTRELQERHRDYIADRVDRSWPDTRENLIDCRDNLRLDRKGPSIAATVCKVGGAVLAVAGGILAAGSMGLVGAGLGLAVGLPLAALTGWGARKLNEQRREHLSERIAVVDLAERAAYQLQKDSPPVPPYKGPVRTPYPYLPGQCI